MWTGMIKAFQNAFLKDKILHFRVFYNMDWIQGRRMVDGENAGSSR